MRTYHGRLASTLLLALIVATLSSCTTVQIGPGGARQVTAIGIVQLKVPPSLGKLAVVERTAVGMGIDGLPGGGAWLGYSEAGWIIADPAQCQLVVVIRAPGEAARARNVLSQMGESACVVDQSNS